MTSVASYDMVAIEKVASVAYLEAIFDSYANGTIAVPIESGAEPPSGFAFAARIVPAAGGGWFARHQAPIHDDRPAQVSFSSGTTGTPKAVLLSHRALADVTQRLVEVMEVTPDIREYLGIPPTYSFGLGRARVIAAVGGRLYVPPRGFDPGELSRMLAAGEVNALSAVPTLLRLLIANRDLINSAAARRLRWLEIGSQAMSAADKRLIREIFPAARIVQHYGLTEASRTTFLDVGQANDAQLDSVGQALGRTEIRIDGEGHVCIRGPHVADGLLEQGDLRPIADAAGWLRTNDLGRIDPEGFLHYLGRADHQLNVGGIKVPADLFEERLGELLGRDAGAVAVTGLADPLRGEIVMVAYLPGAPALVVEDQARAVAREFGLGAADVRLVPVPAIPRTETGKIKRAELAALAPPSAPAAPIETAAADDDTDDTPLSDEERKIAAVWQEVLGVARVSRNDTFFDLGGDSLSAIAVLIRMERAGVPEGLSQQIFEGRTVAEIARASSGGAAPEPPRPALEAITSNAINLTRGLLVLLVIGAHFLPFVLERLGALGDAIELWTWPLFRLGTPGFAMVFGLSLGYFFFPIALSDPARLRTRLRTSLAIIGPGFLLLGALKLIEIVLRDGGLGPDWPTEAFYNVLAYYVLGVLSAGPILRLLGKSDIPVLAALALMVASFAVSVAVQPLLNDRLTGLAHFGSVMLSANYSYFLMTGYVLAGVAMGIWIRRNNRDLQLARLAIWTGSIAAVGGVVLSIAVGLGHRWFEGIPTLPAVVTYAGVVLLAFGWFERLSRAAPARWMPVRILAVLGMLALPAFVLHMAGQPVKEIMVHLHVPEIAANGGALALVVGLLGVAVWRVYRLYY